MFEASVGGGIPLIAPLRRDLLANRITSIRAIINGTTNYILTSMANSSAAAEALRRQGIEPFSRGGYADALAEASASATPADPTNDVEGYDAAYKLAIMASLGFRTRVRPQILRSPASASWTRGLHLRTGARLRHQAARHR
jgi:homoserine dehydrogenase